MPWPNPVLVLDEPPPVTDMAILVLPLGFHFKVRLQPLTSSLNFERRRLGRFLLFLLQEFFNALASFAYFLRWKLAKLFASLGVADDVIDLTGLVAPKRDISLQESCRSGRLRIL